MPPPPNRPPSESHSDSTVRLSPKHAPIPLPLCDTENETESSSNGPTTLNVSTPISATPNSTAPASLLESSASESVTSCSRLGSALSLSPPDSPPPTIGRRVRFAKDAKLEDGTDTRCTCQMEVTKLTADTFKENVAVRMQAAYEDWCDEHEDNRYAMTFNEWKKELLGGDYGSDDDAPPKKPDLTVSGWDEEPDDGPEGAADREHDVSARDEFPYSQHEDDISAWTEFPYSQHRDDDGVDLEPNGNDAKPDADAFDAGWELHNEAVSGSECASFLFDADWATTFDNEQPLAPSDAETASLVEENHDPHMNGGNRQHPHD